MQSATFFTAQDVCAASGCMPDRRLAEAADCIRPTFLGRQATDPPPYPLSPDRDELVGHYLRSDAEPRFRPGLDRGSNIARLNAALALVMGLAD